MSKGKHEQDQPSLWDDLPPQAQPKLAPHQRAAPPPPRPIAPAQQVNSSNGERLWSVSDLADYLGVPVKTIYTWRAKGLGPKGFRLGKHLRWRIATVMAWSLDQEQNQ